MKAKVRPIKGSEWDKWSGEAESLPITCDPAFAGSFRSISQSRDPALPFLISDSAGEALVVAYPLGGRFLRPMTLSPLGLACAVHSSPEPASSLRLLGSFLEHQVTRWRSINYVRPFFIEGSDQSSVPPGSSRMAETHVLSLSHDYETLFQQSFKGATRTCIRRAEASGVEVEQTTDPDAIEAYYRIHAGLAKAKGGYAEVYPKAFYMQLIRECDRAQLLIAVAKGQIIAGAIFLDDGPQRLYWHAAADRAAAALQPGYAVIAASIRSASRERFKWFNFGGSLGIQSLVRFKESWGARAVQQQSCSVSNPAVRMIKRLARKA